MLFYIISETDCANSHRLVHREFLVHFYTMPTVQHIYELLEKRRQELGLSQADVCAKAFGKADNSAFQALRRGSSPSADKLEALCDALDLEFYFGTRRDSGSFEQITVDNVEYVHVPLHDAMLSAGPGTENGDRNIIDHLAFRRDWMRRIGLSPAAACLARVDRDSMAPTLFPGDMVLLDTTKTELAVRSYAKNGVRRVPIYAFVEDGQARVKRIDRPSASMIMLLSDNPDYGPEVLTGVAAAAIKIIGKVVWSGHTLKE